MKLVLFCHSFRSCWNHGNAHFLRGVARELIRLGHEVVVYEPEDGWSLANLHADGGAAVLDETANLVPGVILRSYRGSTPDLDRSTDGAEVVMVHEWTAPELVAALGRHRRRGGAYTLLFHDTHHRAVSAPAEMNALDLEGYDAVLAFGEVLREVYLRRGWARQVFTWHEAADTALFRPLPDRPKDTDLIWIGNWGDDERSQELETFLLDPATQLGLRLRIHGVRYPRHAREMLAERGADHGGWLPNHRAPEAFARARMTVHVPRRPYTAALPGIPTIRVFEALACGIPLASAPWSDEEGLFPAGAYLVARDRAGMIRAMGSILADRDLAESLVTTGLRAIAARHTCAHRVEELLTILGSLGKSRPWSRPTPEYQVSAS